MSAPTVSSVSPTNGSTGVGSVAYISITFDQSIQPATALVVVTSAAGTLDPIYCGYFEYYDTTAEWGIQNGLNIPNYTLRCPYNGPYRLKSGTAYTVTVSLVKNASGTPIASPYSWSFTA